MNTVINKDIFQPFPTLESKRVSFTEFTLKDAQNLLDIRGNNDVVEYMDTAPHTCLADSENMILNIIKDQANKKGINWIMRLKDTDEFIGYFGFWRLDYDHCRGEIGYALHPNYWRNGYLSEALHLMIDFGFNQLQLHGIDANINPGNLPSKGLLEKMGFKMEAHFRENYLNNNKFTDSLIYCLIESDVKDGATES